MKIESSTYGGVYVNLVCVHIAFQILFLDLSGLHSEIHKQWSDIRSSIQIDGFSLIMFKVSPEQLRFDY